MNSPLRSRRFPTTAPDDGRRRRAEAARPREASAQELRAADIDPAWELVPGTSGPQETAGHQVMLKRDKSLRRAPALGDVLSVYLALVISVGLIDGGAVRLRWTAIAIAPVLVLVAKAIGLYDRDQYMLRKTTIDEAPAVLNLAVFYALTLWLAQGLLFNGWLARAQVFGLAVASFAFLLVARGVARAVATRLSPPERVVVLGSARDAERTAIKLDGSSGVNAEIIGRVALHGDDHHSHGDGTSRLGDVRGLARVIAEHRVERVIIAPDSHDQEEILQAVRLVKAIGVKVSVLPRLLEVVGSSSTFDDVDGITMLGVRHFGLSKSSEFLKRVVDIAAAGAGLIVLAPLMLALALAVKLSSKGPVFFRQPRIGQPHDVLIGVRSPDEAVMAHAWLDHEDPLDFLVVARIPSGGGSGGGLARK